MKIKNIVLSICLVSLIGCNGSNNEADDVIIDSPQSANFNTDTIAQPETQQPETQQPETQQPETQQPETQQPEAQQPETQQPETQQPETQQPETQQPETQQPETQQPVDAVTEFINTIPEAFIPLNLSTEELQANSEMISTNEGDIIIYTGDPDSTTTFITQGHRFTSTYELNDESYKSTRTMSTNPVDFSDYVSTGNFSGLWLSDCITEQTVENNVVTYEYSYTESINTSADSVTHEVTTFAQPGCRGTGFTSVYNGFFETSQGTDNNFGQVLQVTDSNIQDGTGIAGHYLMSSDNQHMVKLDGIIQIGYNRVN